MQNMIKTDDKVTTVVQLPFTHKVTSAEATANSLTITIDEMKAVDEVMGVSIRKADGTFNTAGLDVSMSTNVITIAATALTANEVVTGIAFGSLNV